MNRTKISIAVQAAYLVVNASRRYGDGDASTTTTTTTTEPPKFDPAAARSALVEYGHPEETVKGLKDEDVQKLHSTVSKAEQKRIDAALAKTKGEQETTAKSNKEGWEKGTLKLELPKESKLHQSDIDEVAAIARERGLSKDEAAVMLAQREKAAAGFEARSIETMAKARLGWVDTIKADKELGGDNLPETQRLSMLAVERFVSPALREHLRTTGFGDHPEIVRMFRSIGQAMSEDKPGVGGGLSKGGGEKKDAASVLYDNTPA